MIEKKKLNRKPFDAAQAVLAAQEPKTKVLSFDVLGGEVLVRPLSAAERMYFFPKLAQSGAENLTIAVAKEKVATISELLAAVVSDGESPVLNKEQWGVLYDAEPVVCDALLECAIELSHGALAEAVQAAKKD